MDQFSVLLRKLRLQAGMTQEELAERAGVGTRTIRRLETGEREQPRVSTVRLLADALGLRPGEHDELLAVVVGGDSAPVPRQLPAPPAVFVGRHGELAVLDKALDEAAGSGATVVVAAIGGGSGVGKTWLALHWAHRNVDRFPDGQLFVDLRGFAPNGQPMETGEALRGFLGALGVEPAAIPADLASQSALYRTMAADRRMLVVLDNARDTEQAAPLLPGSPTCTVLVTSRDRLAGVITAYGARPLGLDILDDMEAHDLLARRFGEDRLAAEPEATAELVRCCAGLPLALGVVAARAALSPDAPLSALAAELRDARLGGLDAGDPHASVQAALSWSHAALEPAHATVFDLLGLAPGPDISLPAAASLTATPEVGSALRALERVSVIDQRDPGRYRLHDLVKLFAADQGRRSLSARARDTALRRLIDFYLHTAHTAERLLEPDRDPVQLDSPAQGCHPLPLDNVAVALAWLDAEHTNLLAAQRSAVHRGWHALVWQLAWALDTFHWRRAYRHDHLAAWQAGLAAAEESGDLAAQALARRCLGRVWILSGHPLEAVPHLRRALALAEQIDDIPGQAHIHTTLAKAWDEQGDLERALEHATRSVRLFRAFGDPVWEAWALNGMGWLTARQGDHRQAREHCEAALDLFRGQPNRHGESIVLDSLGYIAHHGGRHTDALCYYQQALALRRELGNTPDEARTLDRMALTHSALDQPEQARAAWRQAAQLYRQLGREQEAERVQQHLVQ